MQVLIDERAEECLGTEMEDVIRAIAADTLAYEGFSSECEVSVSVVDGAEIQTINRQFRGIDRVTDVLSFPQLTFTEGEIPEKNENGEIVLGDIILCLQRAKEQAAE